MSSSRLKQIQNWPDLAREANWSAAELARKCDVSVRTLHRFFLDQTGKNTKAWLAEQRQHDAISLLGNGSSIKETAIQLGYKQQTNFTRQFKNQTGACPSKLSAND